MLIKVTNWEAQRIADILRVGEVPPSQVLWAQDLADRIEYNLEKHKENQRGASWRMKLRK